MGRILFSLMVWCRCEHGGRVLPVPGGAACDGLPRRDGAVPHAAAAARRARGPAAGPRAAPPPQDQERAETRPPPDIDQDS